ncbi:MAG: molybdopterin-synthase adenylyltransferase MoeB [Gemmatimonadota bacterium]
MPTARFTIPAPLRSLVGERRTVDVEADTVGAALRGLADAEPRLGARLFRADGSLRGYVHVFFDGRDVRDLDSLDEPIPDGADLRIVPSIAGGAPDRAPGPEELRRYARQIILPEVGTEGQARLKAASVLLVGAGGLGSPLALYLAAAGVGRIGIVDADEVGESNLHRQVLHETRDVGRPKTESAADRLERLNPHVCVEAHGVRLSSGNALDILGAYDLVADGSDNFPTRYLVSDAAVLLGIPNVYGAVYRFEGQASVFGLPGGPCYRCLFRDPPPPELVPSCAEAGVLGVLPGLVGMIQATEAIKLILGLGTSLSGRLLLVDGLGMEFRELAIRRDPECPACGDAPSIRELVDYEAFCSGAAETRAAPDAPAVPEVGPRELAARLEAGESPQIVDVREEWEWKIVNLAAAGAALIPLGELADRAPELDPERETIAYCHTGQRSEVAVRILRAAGFRKVSHLRGGIHAWTAEVDPDLPTY